MDVQLGGLSQDALDTIISVFIPALVGLAFLAVTALAGAGAWASVRTLARQVRGLVDEPDDLIIVTLDGIGEWALRRELDAALISKLLTATCDALAKQPPAPPEPETVK